MDNQDKTKNPIKTVARSVFIIVWWVCVWGLTDYIIHHMASKDPFRKVIVYIGLMLLVLGTIGLDPHMLYHM
jgi:hypothetical protein